MQRRTPTDFNDYWQIFQRQRWWVIVPAVLVSMVVFLVSAKLPRSFRSETFILVDSQKVPAEYVKATVSSDVTERLQTISQEILSRTHLEKIIEQYGLYPDKRSLPMEDVVDFMRRDIDLAIVSDKNNRASGIGGFRLSYIGAKPEVAQQVTRQLGSLFIEENLKVRESQAEGTNEFIESELVKAKQVLDAHEKQVKEFKSRYSGGLPEQEQSNLQLIGQTQALLQANSDTLNRLQQQKSYTETMMESMGKGMTPTGAKPTSPELEALRRELVTLQQKYTANHPDVISVKSQIAALEAELSKSVATDPATGQSGVPANVRAQLKLLDSEIANRNKKQVDLENRIRALQGRVENLPRVEQEFAEINRDYTVSKANYEALLAKQNSSQMAAEMERRAKGEQFRIVDPASYPMKPAKPNLPMINLGGLLVGLMVGGGMGFLRELRDRSIHTEKDVSHYLNAPVLGVMLVIHTEQSLAEAKRKTRRQWVIGAASAAAFLGTFVLAITLLVRRGALDLSGFF